MYSFAGAVDDSSEVNVNRFAPGVIFVEDFGREHSGVVDAYVEPSEDILVAGICGS